MPDLPAANFGPFVILQFAGAVMMLGMLTLAVIKGVRDRRVSPEVAPDTRYFLNGPVKSALDLLGEIRDLLRMRDIRDILKRSEAHLEPLGEQLRNIKGELNEIRRDLDDIKSIKYRR